MKEYNRRPDVLEKNRINRRGRVGRNYNLKQKYQLTAEQWEDLFAEQGWACAICEATALPDGRFWHTDHDHRTGEVRGILCRACNHLIGNAKDDPAILVSAITYLKGRFRGLFV
ncbi:MAG: endonuclease VII domain-containing protein [Pirellulales bacterium]